MLASEPRAYEWQIRQVPSSAAWQHKHRNMPNKTSRLCECKTKRIPSRQYVTTSNTKEASGPCMVGRRTTWNPWKPWETMVQTSPNQENDQDDHQNEHWIRRLGSTLRILGHSYLPRYPESIGVREWGGSRTWSQTGLPSTVSIPHSISKITPARRSP